MKKRHNLTSENLISSPWLKVYKDSVQLPNGSVIDDFYYVRTANAAAVVAVDGDMNIILKKEYRYALGEELIEIPAGMMGEDEDPLGKRQTIRLTVKLNAAGL